MTRQTLLDKFPDRFGWRIWGLVPSIGRLISPCEGSMLSGNIAVAKCPTQEHDSPHPTCYCGVHFYHQLDRLRSQWAYPLFEAGLGAITFGVTTGNVMLDYDLGRNPGSWRCQRYHILAVCLPREHADAYDAVSRNHRVPTLIGLTRPEVESAQAVVPDYGECAGWFSELANRPDPVEDAAAQRFNAVLRQHRNHPRCRDWALDAYNTPQRPSVQASPVRDAQRSAWLDITEAAAAALLNSRRPSGQA